MDMLSIYRNGSDEVLFDQVRHARTPWQRFRGLIARPRLGEHEGMLISPCGSVHTLGMRYPLDIVFMDRDGRVLKCVNALQPCRAAGSRSARYTLELAPGGIARAAVVDGEVLSWRINED